MFPHVIRFILYVTVSLSCRPAAAGLFSEERLRPYLVRGTVAKARRALISNKPEQAVKVLRRYLTRGRRRSPHRRQARTLLAHALLQSERFAEAEKIFASLIKSYPLLADYHLFYRAICQYRLKKFVEATATASRVSKGSVLKTDAELLRADILRALNRDKEEREIWTAYLQRHPKGARVGKSHFRIGECLEREASKGGDQAARLRAEALQHYKQVTLIDPMGDDNDAAVKRIAALSAVLTDGAEKARLSPWQRYAQAKAYARAMRHRLAEPVLTSLLQDKEISPNLLCKASYQLARTVFRQRQRARSAPLYEAAEQACRAVENSDLVVKSLFNGARGLVRAKKPTEAIAKLGIIEKEFAKHSYADDARLLAAEYYDVMSQDPAVDHDQQIVQLLSKLPDTYPSGDMSREALWRLARRQMDEKKTGQAIATLDRIIDELGPAKKYNAFGQAMYWKARLLGNLGRRREARRLYERCIREYPLSYYALMAFNRLRERHRPVYRKLYRELIAPVGKRAGDWQFKARPVNREPGFIRGVELARLGFGDDAAREMTSVGLGIKRGAPLEDLWLLAVLFDRAGLWHLSHHVPRGLDSAYRLHWPLKSNYHRWAISYPRAFEPLVIANAKQARISRWLVLAIMREESGFLPTVESWANAVGLMQLLLPTAKRAGSEHRLEITRKRLKDPVVNIKVGTTYLSFLYRSFRDNSALAIAGYNAGEGAVLKWLKRQGRVPLDQFIDHIPYDQTRRYTKRVLSSLFTYSVLYGQGTGRIPRLKQTLPGPEQVSFSRAKKSKRRVKKGRKRRKR